MTFVIKRPRMHASLVLLLAYFVEKLVGEIGDLGGLSSKRGLHSG
jgi:hypothetical protein